MPPLPLDTNRFTATWATCARSALTSSSSAACLRGELCSPVREDVEVGLRLGEVGGRLVGPVTRRADLASSFFSSVLVGTWARGGGTDCAGCDDECNCGGTDSSTKSRRAATHGGAP